MSGSKYKQKLGGWLKAMKGGTSKRGEWILIGGS